jgi:hypothetical protein
MGLPEKGMFTKVASKAFRSKTTIIFSWLRGMLSATHCEPIWSIVPSSGVGVRFTGG